MSAPLPSVGSKIELNDGRIAHVRFVGLTSFQTGEWVGVELEEATGKNDGSVKGERYFECEPGYGMFLRPTGVRQVLEKPRSKPESASNGAPTTAAKPMSTPAGSDRTNGLQRQSLVVDGRRKSVVPSSLVPGVRAGLGGVRSPAKSPTKQLGSNGVASSGSTSRTNTPPVGKTPATARPTTGKPRPSTLPPATAAARRTSIVPSAPTSSTQRTVRPSLAPASSGPRATSVRTVPGQASSARAPPAAKRTDHLRLSSETKEETDDTGSEQSNLLSPNESEESSAASQPGTNDDGGDDDDDNTVRPSFAPPPIPPEPPSQSRSRRPSSPAAASVHSQRTIRSTIASNRQIEELEAKVRLLERKRMEDRDLKKRIEQAQQERDQYKGIIEKLQNKYRPQQQEITDLKQALSESEKKFGDIEAIQAEHDSIMEMATLDREMAEETAESLKAELEALRAQNEEVQLELDILREENGELTKEMSPEERESAGWTHMQASNDRLRNALLALRDRYLDEKESFEDTIKGFENQIKELEPVKAYYEDTREKLLRSEADTTDLRQQLEVAQQADEIIEELTERNGQLEGMVSDLRANVTDLEDLKELNDELEINHVEAEKQMQDEIDFRDSLLLDRERILKQQQGALDDADSNITQFRQLVRMLQGDLSDMKASKQISESEAKELEGKSRAMMDLNLKLQSSAAKTQIKTIDLELRKLEAQEASEHLAIVQLFLPEAFHSERDSVLALLRFKRIAFKATLVHSFVQERIASFGTRGQDEDVFSACDVLVKLTWIAGMAERFVNSICGCSVEAFAKYESALYELEPVERALNGYIDSLRREELNGKPMAEELQRSIAVMDHLAGIHITDDLPSHADALLMRTSCMQSQLESAATALQLCRSMVEKSISHADDSERDNDEVTASDFGIILNRAETLVTHARSAKVMAGKTHRSLHDLQIRSLTLESGCTESFDNAEIIAKEVAEYTRLAGEALQTLFGEEGRTQTVTPAEVSSTISTAASAAFSLPTSESGPFNALAARMRDFTDVLTDLAALPTDLDNTVEFERQPAPWVARANELKMTKITNVDTEAELARTLEDLRGRDELIKEKETELEEQSVRIEMLEARMKEATKRSAQIAELEREMHKAKDNERRLRRQYEQERDDKERAVQQVREEMGRLSTRRGNIDGELDDGAMGAGTRLTMERQELKITSLEGAVRYLKAENHRLRLPPLDSPAFVQSKLSWLSDLPINAKSERQVRRENLHKEGRDVLQHLLALATRPQAIDLTKMPENKLAWRPAKDRPRWRVEIYKEEWEQLKDWQQEVVKKGLARGPRTHVNRAFDDETRA